MAEYLRYKLKNLEPVRISDGASIQEGQTDTLRFIPGSTIRGYVINRMVNKKDFEEKKNLLFSDSLMFMNLYPTTETHTLIPSPKGFYEDKRSAADGEKDIQNVVINGDFSDGYKRASLGQYCYIENGCIHYYSIHTGADLKILRNTSEKKNVFRNEYIAAGYCFEGFIRLSDDRSLNVNICKLFEEGRYLFLGNSRFAGQGKCEVVFSEIIDHIPYMKAGFTAKNEAYMMLLSDTVLRNENGELCGIDLNDKYIKGMLENSLGISDLEIKYASTTIRRIISYNRTLGGKLPSMPAYQAGSVFHLCYNGEIIADKMIRFCDTGLGLRKNEGFGRVMFFDKYEKVSRKHAEKFSANMKDVTPAVYDQLSDSEKESLRTAARGHYLSMLNSAMINYVLYHPFDRGGISNSQLGSLQAIMLKFREDPDKARKELDKLFQHSAEKEESRRNQKEKRTVFGGQAQVYGILDKELNDILFDNNNSFCEKGKVMGIKVFPDKGEEYDSRKHLFTKKDEEKYKLMLLIKMIRSDYREV